MADYRVYGLACLQLSGLTEKRVEHSGVRFTTSGICSADGTVSFLVLQKAEEEQYRIVVVYEM
jgi:hypothetical protein